MQAGPIKYLRFLLSGQFWLTLIKLFLVFFVLFMLVIQIPELRYDTLGDRPVIIEGPSDLDPGLLRGSSYAKISATANFEHAFVYQRYGLSYTYFMLDPYGVQIIARAYGTDTSEWDTLSLFEGKLRPFAEQPFAYVIRGILLERFGITAAEDAYYIGVGDVPEANAWQIGSIIFAAIMLFLMVYFFFFFQRDRQKRVFSDPLDYINKGISGKSTQPEQTSSSKSEFAEPTGYDSSE